MLYQAFFTIIVRIQAKRQPLTQVGAFRQKMTLASRDVRREASALGYSSEDILDAELATIAFLDEVILTSGVPECDEWAKKTLSVELLGEAAAGDRFFERLDALQSRRDSLPLADLLEVYLLCLLLGFEGRYTLMKERLQPIAQVLRERIERLRGPKQQLTPEAALPDRAPEPIAPPPPAPGPVWSWRLTLAAALISATLCFIVLKLTLQYSASQIAEMIRG
jgi:type VI secretion system protein ImpK